MHIYKTTNLINGIIYVGQNKNNNKYYLGSGDKIRAAIKKYGKENFKKEILEECKNLETLNEREIYWIDKLKATDKSIGYNIDPGGSDPQRFGDLNGMFGRKHSRETKEKMRQKAIGRKASRESRKKMSDSRKGKSAWNKGVPITEETRAKISEASKKQVCSDETREKLRLSSTGRTHSEETRNKLSAVAKQRKYTHEERAKISRSVRLARQQRFWSTKK